MAVVIPAYNAERFLAETLDSVLAQGYADWHAWIGDDASTDDTLALARSYAARDQRVTVLALEPNAGVVATRNRLMQACAGIELVALLDHDDLWRADYLERSVALFDAAAARGGAPGVVASDARILEGDRMAPDTVAERFDFGDPSDYRQMLQHNSVFARALIGRAAFDATDGFVPECAGADDYDLWLQIMDAGYEIVATSETLSTYRWGGLSRDRVAMARANQAVFRRALARGRNAAGHKRLIRLRLLHERAQYARARATEAAGRRALPATVGWAAVALPLWLATAVSQPGRLARQLRRALARPGR